MVDNIVRAALKHRLILVVIAAVMCGFGVHAAQKLSVDAFPDVTNIQVQIATEAPGKSPEEVDAALSDPRIPDSAKSAIRKALGLPDAPARKSPDNQMLTSDGVEAPAL